MSCKDCLRECLSGVIPSRIGWVIWWAIAGAWVSALVMNLLPMALVWVYWVVAAVLIITSWDKRPGGGD